MAKKISVGYLVRPFKVRNAEEIPEELLLDMFVVPGTEVLDPLDYENLIIKGRMGSGKTMVLRANLLFYRYILVSTLIDGEKPILPVFIRFSDFQHLKDPREIYSAVILKIIEEIVGAHKLLQDAKMLANLHKGVSFLKNNYDYPALKKLSGKLLELSAAEFVTRVTSVSSGGATAKAQFVELAGGFEKKIETEIKKKASPGIVDVEAAYKAILEPFSGSLLLLADEASALTNKFFIEDGRETSLFETLMNQLRTAPYLRVKFAVYPNSYSDVLTETRYGDFLNLSEDVTTEEGFASFQKKAIELIERYVNSKTMEKFDYKDFFEVEEDGFSRALEQLIYASGGNIRRLILLLDRTFQLAYSQHKGTEKVSLENCVEAIKSHAQGMEDQHGESEKVFLASLASACKDRSAYKFVFPYKAPLLSKFISKSEEQNVLKIVEAGSGQRGTQYSFDYSYCVLKGIPTHYFKDSERINSARSHRDGGWIAKKATMREEFLRLVERSDRLEGEISFLTPDRNTGFVKDAKGGQYYFTGEQFLTDVDKQGVELNKKVKFSPVLFDKSGFAFQIEVLS